MCGPIFLLSPFILCWYLIKKGIGEDFGRSIRPKLAAAFKFDIMLSLLVTEEEDLLWNKRCDPRLEAQIGQKAFIVQRRYKKQKIKDVEKDEDESLNSEGSAAAAEYANASSAAEQRKERIRRIVQQLARQLLTR